MKRFITAVSAGFALAVMALAAPAVATEDAPLTASHTVECREHGGGVAVTVTFTNLTGHTYSADVQRDDEPGSDDEMTGSDIAAGPHAGKPFGQRFNAVDLPAGETVTETIQFKEDSDHRVQYRIWRGPENDLYVDWKGTGQLDTDCLPEPEPTGSPSPSPSPDPSGEPTEGPSESPSGDPSESPSAPASTDPVDDPDQGTGDLPTTGTSLPLIAGLGAALITGGAATLWVMRRRRVTAQE